MSSPDSPSDDGDSSATPGPEVSPDEIVPEPDAATAPGDVADPDPEDVVDPEIEIEIEVESEAEDEAEPVIDAAAAMVDVQQTTTKRHKRRRSWGQRVLLGANCLVILACFVGATGLLIGRHYGNSLNKVDLAEPTFGTDPSAVPVGTVAEGGDPTDGTGVTPSTVEAGPVETFPAIDPEAQNFLITGADNNACIDPDSPYAAAFGDRESMGERSDTIMLMRVDPKQHLAAVLSFPRDLWVDIPGRGGKSRINSAYVRDDPNKLIETIGQNFYLGVNHFIQVDFCAFKKIVDVLGGVTVPFEYATRDTHTGLNVPEPGCFTFNGDHALAYVRSRHYQYFDDNGKWKEDPASDLGRISRQQDFLRRVLSTAIAKGFDVGVARGIIKAAQDYVVVDNDLTINRMLEFAGVLADFEPGAIATYQIESTPQNIGGNAVLVPKIKGANMQAILDIFRGNAPLAGAPEQVFDTTTSSTEAGATTTTDSSVTTSTVLEPEQTVTGIVPPDDMSC